MYQREDEAHKYQVARLNEAHAFHLGRVYRRGHIMGETEDELLHKMLEGKSVMEQQGVMSAVVGSQDNLNTFAKEVMEGTETTEKKLKAVGKAEADRIRGERETQAILDAEAKRARQHEAKRKFAMRVDESIQAGHKMLKEREVVAKSYAKK